MGFHVCEYCTQSMVPEQRHHPSTSSGDVTLFFKDRGLGHKWVMPDMIVHYVQVHNYLPPTEFIEDVMQGRQVIGVLGQTNRITSLTPTRSVGYLDGIFPQGDVPADFLEKLQSLMELAKANGDRRQTRGI